MACSICHRDIGRALAIDGMHHSCATARERLSNLARCLRDAGALCAADSVAERRGFEECLWVVRGGSLAPHWRPGCGRPLAPHPEQEAMSGPNVNPAWYPGCGREWKP